MTTEGMSPADMAAVVGNNDGFGFGGGSIWLIVLFLFAMMGGWGNGFGNNNGWAYASQTNDLITNGFNQAATANTLNGIQNAIYQNQIDELNRSFDAQTANTAALFGIQSQLAQCCCDNRSAIADLKYTVASEACEDRNAVSNALRDVLTANTASTQRILDQLCQDKIDAKNDLIAQLRQEILYARGQASQNEQTAVLRAGQDAIYNKLYGNTCGCGGVV